MLCASRQMVFEPVVLGPKGFKGVGVPIQGPQGERGLPGSPGRTGLPGRVGERGLKGNDGLPGDDCGVCKAGKFLSDVISSTFKCKIWQCIISKSTAVYELYMPRYTSQRRGTACTFQFLLLLCMFHSLYSVYRLCVNVYCTAATGKSGHFLTTLRFSVLFPQL
jgi:hypothetical protein